ncbi:MAG TPA: protoporphyrinogen oxidase [Ktedonobacterales bacterium]
MNIRQATVDHKTPPTSPFLTGGEDGRTPASSPHIAILGGGIAGLSAAWYLQQAFAGENLPASYTVIERDGQWGGKVRSERVERAGKPAWVLEAGPDGLLTRKPWALALARALKLDDNFIFVNRENSRTFVLRRGRPVPLPAGLQLLAPTRWLPFLRSPLFTPWGKLRIALDLLLPARRSTADESLASFVRRRFGNEALQRLADPLMAGVFNAEPERQSILATFPQFAALERSHGSVIRGLRAASRGQPPATTPQTPAFLSFENGNQALVDALIARLTGTLYLNTAARSITRTDDGGYTIALEDGRSLAADAVVLATPASVSAALVGEVAPEAAALLDSIRYAGIGAIYLAYRRADIPHPLNGTGVVIPSSEGRPIDGITWVSSKWEHRAPAEHALVRVFFGGPHTREMLSLDDERLTAIVRGELADILGARAEPLFTRIFRWPDGYPQYDIGHLERVAAIEAALPEGLVVAGSSYRGVGVPDCIHQGEMAATQVTELLRNKRPATRRLPA